MTIFAFPGDEELTLNIAKTLNYKLGDVVIKNFPDGETFVKLNTDIKDIKHQDITVVCSLNNPNQKAMALMFFFNILREYGANEICLVAPYLGYMRKDQRFSAGEVVTSNIFSKFLSNKIDFLITVDPYFRHNKSLNNLYSIRSIVLHTSDLIADWIKNNINNPVIISSSQESEHWISDIANKIAAPYIISNEEHLGDGKIDIDLPDINQYKSNTPVIIGSIISTAATMIKTVEVLNNVKLLPPVCIGVHAIFAGDSYNKLKNAGATQIVTCNTINHVTNKIDISLLLANSLKSV